MDPRIFIRVFEGMDNSAWILHGHFNPGGSLLPCVVNVGRGFVSRIFINHVNFLSSVIELANRNLISFI